MSRASLLTNVRNRLRTTAKLKWSEAGMYLYVPKYDLSVVLDPADNELSVWDNEHMLCAYTSPATIASYINERVDGDKK